MTIIHRSLRVYYLCSYSFAVAKLKHETMTLQQVFFCDCMHHAFIRKHQLNPATFDSSQCDNLNICCNTCMYHVRSRNSLKINFPRLSWLEKNQKLAPDENTHLYGILLSLCSHNASMQNVRFEILYIVTIMFSKMCTCKKYIIKWHIPLSYLGYVSVKHALIYNNFPSMGQDCDSIHIIHFSALYGRTTKYRICRVLMTKIFSCT